MNVLIEPAREILFSLGRQKRYNDKNYRLNKFCLIEEIMNGKLIYNGLTRCFIFISNNEFEKIYDKDLCDNITNFMYDAYFLVEEDFNEHQFINEMRDKNVKPIDDYTFKTINEYTILTTTACNARCFYCYEQKVKKSTMSIETAYKVIKYISDFSNIENEIALRWFGGEPLFNMKVIDTICEGLTKKGIKYRSYFTTNGYLFDEDVIKKAVELWHCVSCQITIDGTEKVYNKAKNYIYKDDKSPYQRVMRNIYTLLDNNVNVGIRMNVDMYNANDLKDLIYEVFSTIGNHPNLHLYCYPIFENEFYSRTEDERKQVFDKIEEIEKVLDDCGYFFGDNLYDTYKTNHCMADCADAVTISPNGDLGVCEHCIDYDFIGHINNPTEIDMDVVKSWRVYEEDMDICDDCPNYPFCKRAKKCEEQSKCDEYIKNWKIRKIKQGMRLTYYNILNQQRNNNF
jgi:sulfatase maturation enzyme AslB (radical SAM superfamily)